MYSQLARRSARTPNRPLPTLVGAMLGVPVFLLLCVASSALAAQDFERKADDAALERIFLDPALATADYDAHLKTLISLMSEAPGTIAGATALRRAMKLQDQCATMRPLLDWLLGQVDNDFSECGIYADDYAQACLDLARKYTDDLHWHEVARKWRGVAEWACIGPLTEGLHTAHDDVFGPEVMLDFDARYNGAFGAVTWQPVRHDDPLESRINLWMQHRFNGGCYYLCTALVSDADRDVLLRISLNASGKVWLNGQLIVDADYRGQDWPEIMLGASLARGRNLLLIKVSGLIAVEARVRAPDGGLLSGVVTVQPKPGDPRQAVRAATPVGTPFVPGMGALEHSANWRGATAHSSAIGYLAMASLYDAHSMRWESVEACEAALSLFRGSEPLAQLEFLRLLDASPLHSTSERRRLRSAIADALYGSGSQIIPAALEKAKLLTEDQRYTDAAKLLEELRRVSPENWRISLALAEVYRDANWRTEALRELKHAQSQAPAAIPVLRALSRHHAANHELASRVAIERQILKQMPGDRESLHALVSTLQRMAEGEEALRHARKLAAADPADGSTLELLAEALAACGKLDEALQVWQQAAALTPRPEDVLKQAARACLQLGAEDKAVKLLERVLAESPGQHAARRQLQRMRGESEDFWSAHALTWDEALKHDVNPEDFPRAGSALVLDEMVQVIYADGSSVSYVHQVRKILTQDGVDERGKERIPGELVTARTVTPEGKVLEPIRQPGGLVEFPGVSVGCYIDVAYIERNEPNPHGTLDGHRFYFADHEMSEPFCISRWVLIAPREQRLQFVYRNMVDGKDGVSIDARVEGSQVVHTWDVRNPQHPEYEPYMPSALEFMPWMECVVAHDWRERARKLAEEGLADRRVTNLIRTKADELVHEISGDVPRARAIYDWVNQNFATRGDAWNAHQALKAGAGDRRKLFIALCTAAGIELGFAAADSPPPYKQADHDRLPRPHWAYPDDEDFDSFLIVVWDDAGNPVYIDMEQRLRPFAELSPRLSNAPVIVWRGGDYRLTHLPGGERAADRYENRTKIVLAADGSAKLSGTMSVHGERSYNPKESMRNATQDQLRRIVEGELASYYRGIEVSESAFPGLAEVGTPLTRTYTGEVAAFATVASDTLTVDMPGEKLLPIIQDFIAKDNRNYDIAMPFDLVQTDETRIVAPKGFAFAALPDDLLYPTAPLEYSLKFRLESDTLVITRNFAIGPGRITPADYPAFVGQVKQIRQAEEVRIKLVQRD